MLIIVTHGIVQDVRAQHLHVEPYYEKNSFGNQFGGILALEFSSKLQIGGFYQSELGQGKENSSKYAFTGLYLKLPIYKADRIMLSAFLRGGVANSHFIIVTPGLETQLKIFNRLSISTIMSLRAGNPALGLKGSFRIF